MSVSNDLVSVGPLVNILQSSCDGFYCDGRWRRRWNSKRSLKPLHKSNTYWTGSSKERQETKKYISLLLIPPEAWVDERLCWLAFKCVRKYCLKKKITVKRWLIKGDVERFWSLDMRIVLFQRLRKWFMQHPLKKKNHILGLGNISLTESLHY